MRSVLPVSTLLAAVAVAFIASGDLSQAATPPPPAAETPEVTVEVTLQEGRAPTVQVVSAADMPREAAQLTPKIVHLPPALVPADEPIFYPPANPTAAGDDFVDTWQRLVEETFEDAFPDYPPCWVFDARADGWNRTWGKDDLKPHRGTYAGWPARGGQDGVDPRWKKYPRNLSSSLRCGPFDPGQIDKFPVRFARWLEINDPDDNLFIGVSADGWKYEGLTMSGVSGWTIYNLYFNWLAGRPEAWVLWQFESDGDDDRAGGAWIDDLEIWQYHRPVQTCGDLDPGRKGVALPPHDPTAGEGIPIIRAGDTQALHRIVAGGADWVRLGFIQQNDAVHLPEYDRIVDSLCAAGISVVGLVNDETLLRQDFNDPVNAAAYRQAFAAKAAFIARHFKGRIKYWEVWNEPNYDPSGGGQAPPFIAPERYAPLLKDASDAIKQANPEAQILFGGLAGAWGDSHNYFVEVYDLLDNKLGGARPFDYFAVHPYPNKEHGPNPSVYMYAVDRPWHTNIIDKFTERMALRKGGNKKIWITEVGWNSAKGSPNRPVCHDPVLVTEAEQAAYLKPMFDILLNQVRLWNQPGVAAVEKVIWYQYMDVGIADPCTAQPNEAGHAYLSAQAILPAGQGADWRFGLYRGDKVTPKPVWCAFVAYPLTCDQYFRHKTYLPATMKNQ